MAFEGCSNVLMFMVDYTKNLFWKDLYSEKFAETSSPPTNQPVLLMGSMLVKQRACLPKKLMIFQGKLNSGQFTRLQGRPWKLVTIVSKLVYNLFTGRNQPTYIGVIRHLLSTMDIQVKSCQ